MFKKVFFVAVVLAAFCLVTAGCTLKIVDLKIADGDWKSQYIVGEAFVPVPITVVYSNGREESGVITESMVEGFDTETAGVKKLIITYRNFKTERTVTVNDLTRENFPDITIDDRNFSELDEDSVSDLLDDLYIKSGSPENLDVGESLFPPITDFFNESKLGADAFHYIYAKLFRETDCFTEVLRRAAAEFDFRTVTADNASDAFFAVLKYFDRETVAEFNAILKDFSAVFLNDFTTLNLLKYLCSEVFPSEGSPEGGALSAIENDKFFKYVAAAFCKAIENAEERGDFDSEIAVSNLEFIKDIALEYAERGDNALISILGLLSGSSDECELGANSYTYAEFFERAAALGDTFGKFSDPLVGDLYFRSAFGQAALSLKQNGSIGIEADDGKFAADCTSLLYVADFAADVLAAAENGIPGDDTLPVITQWLLFPSLPGENRLEAAFGELCDFIRPVYDSMTEEGKAAVAAFVTGESCFSANIPENVLTLLSRSVGISRP